MAAVPGVTRRLRDADRDSKILRDMPSKPHWNFDSVASEMGRSLDGVRHHRKQSTCRVERVFPRRPPAWDCEGEQEFQSHNDIISSNEEVESWFLDYMNTEAPSLGVYRKNTESESIIVRFKRNMPSFDGVWHSDDLLRWIVDIEDFFAEVRPPRHLKCKIVWSKMKGKAYYWWKLLQQQRIEHGKEEIVSWSMMKKLLISIFVPKKCSTKVLSQSCGNKEGKGNDSRPFVVFGDICDDIANIKFDNEETQIGGVNEETANILEPEICEENMNDGLNEGLNENILNQVKERSELIPGTCYVNIPFEVSRDKNLGRIMSNEIQKTEASLSLKPCSIVDAKKHKGMEVVKHKEADLNDNEGKEECDCGCLVANVITVKSACSHPLSPIYGSNPQVGRRVNTCGVSCSKPLKLFDRIWNELSYMFNGDWRTYGYCVAERSIHHKLLNIMHKLCDMGMLYKPLIRNFDPGGNLQRQLSISVVFSIWLALAGDSVVHSQNLESLTEVGLGMEFSQICAKNFVFAVALRGRVASIMNVPNGSLLFLMFLLCFTCGGRRITSDNTRRFERRTAFQLKVLEFNIYVFKLNGNKSNEHMLGRTEVDSTFQPQNMCEFVGCVNGEVDMEEHGVDCVFNIIDCRTCVLKPIRMGGKYWYLEFQCGFEVWKFIFDLGGCESIYELTNQLSSRNIGMNTTAALVILLGKRVLEKNFGWSLYLRVVPHWAQPCYLL